MEYTLHLLVKKEKDAEAANRWMKGTDVQQRGGNPAKDR